MKILFELLLELFEKLSFLQGIAFFMTFNCEPGRITVEGLENAIKGMRVTMVFFAYRFCCVVWKIKACPEIFARHVQQIAYLRRAVREIHFPAAGQSVIMWYELFVIHGLIPPEHELT